MTYSIVARDPDTGELGVAVQSATFGVGTVVPWARPGVGAVATQALGEPAYGPRCLAAIVAGASAAEALTKASAASPPRGCCPCRPPYRSTPSSAKALRRRRGRRRAGIRAGTLSRYEP